MRTLLIAVLCLCGGTSTAADERILVDATINDQAVRLAFDTGATQTILFRPTVRRLGLKVTEPSTDTKLRPGRVRVARTEECRLDIGLTAVTCRLGVLDLPGHIRPEVDGVLAWANLRSVTFRIDGKSRKLSTPSALPEDVDAWTKWDMGKDSGFLTATLPRPDGTVATILVDTGSSSGVELSAERWQNWRNVHPDQRITLTATYRPSSGLGVYEECWATELSIGALSLTDVPVMESPEVFTRMFRDYEATLGLFALTRLDMIIDGQNGTIYVRPNTEARWRYTYNRTGAVFVPRDAGSEHLVAQVAEKSPAQRAGIRNGDHLLKIDDLDVTKWRTDPNVLPLARFWEQPAGTRLKLSLARDGRPFNVTVELEEIFPEASPAAAGTGQEDRV